MATYNYVDNGQDDGSIMGRSGGKIAFYGETPVVQASAITTLATTPTATDIATAVNSIIAALANVGITA